SSEPQVTRTTMGLGFDFVTSRPKNFNREFSSCYSPFPSPHWGEGRVRGILDHWYFGNNLVIGVWNLVIIMS
ncbi:MAG: hypothetical protein ACXU9M_14360, partial [Thermodesulfobacteriota bacterium]